jgi:hypothetical protein
MRFIGLTRSFVSTPPSCVGVYSVISCCSELMSEGCGRVAFSGEARIGEIAGETNRDSGELLTILSSSISIKRRRRLRISLLSEDGKRGLFCRRQLPSLWLEIER